MKIMKKCIDCNNTARFDSDRCGRCEEEERQKKIYIQTENRAHQNLADVLFNHGIAVDVAHAIIDAIQASIERAANDL